MTRKYAITVKKNDVTITLLVTNLSLWFAMNEVFAKLHTLGINITDANIIKIENIEDVS